MKTFFKPSNILFYLLSSFLFFFLGMVIAAITGAGEGLGLAGGAVVLGYGVILGCAACISSIFSVRFLKENYVVLLNKIFAVIITLFTAFFIYRYLTLQDGSEKSISPKTKTTLPITGSVNFQSKISGKYYPPMGLGMIKPKYYEQNVL